MTTLAPCPTEDSTNCFWDAINVGNHQGEGFVDINGILFPLVNDPSWGVTVTAVHYDCDDFTLPECQPYADYNNIASDPAPEPSTEAPAPIVIAETPATETPVIETPATETVTVTTQPEPTPGLAETGFKEDVLGGLTIVAMIVVMVGVTLVLKSLRKG